MPRSGFVSVVGRPNVGKSTLINRIVGQKVAIVTPKPQTTRNRILAVANTERAQIVFFDTPGIHKPKHEMNRLMVESAVSSLKRVELVALMVDITQPLAGADEYLLDLVRSVEVPVFLVINKMDRVPKSRALPLIDEYRQRYTFAEIIPVSALTGDNVPSLVRQLEDYLPEAPPLFPEDTLTNLPERFFVSEIIREKIMLHIREEVPYATAVRIDSWKDGAELVRIEASILVERESQKGILVGSKGSMLKKIGTAARREIEAFLNAHIYLGLHVKVREHWRENPRLLAELGMEPPAD